MSAIAGSSCYLTVSSSTAFINWVLEHCPRLCLGVSSKLTQTFTNDLHHSGHKLFCLPCRQYHNIHSTAHTPREATALSRPCEAPFNSLNLSLACLRRNATLYFYTTRNDCFFPAIIWLNQQTIWFYFIFSYRCTVVVSLPSQQCDRRSHINKINSNECRDFSILVASTWKVISPSLIFKLHFNDFLRGNSSTAYNLQFWLRKYFVHYDGSWDITSF